MSEGSIKIPTLHITKYNFNCCMSIIMSIDFGTVHEHNIIQHKSLMGKNFDE